MLTKVAQAVRGRKVTRRLRDEDLTAVSGRCDTRSSVDVYSYVTLLGDDGLPGVHAHPDSDRTVAERVAARPGSGERLGCFRERDEERVTLCVHLHAAMARERVTQGAPVLGQRRRILITEFLQQPRRPLHVRKEERNGAGRKLGHTGIMRRACENV